MNINLQAWFKKAIAKERWKEPGWVIKLFCVTELENINDLTVSVDNPPPPYELFINLDDKSYCYWDDESKEFVPINDSDVTEPLFNYKDHIQLNPGDLPNVTVPTKTTYGNCIVNLYCCVYAFGSKIPFFSGKLTKGGKEILEVILPKIVKDQANPQPDEILPSEIDLFKKAVSSMAVFAVICCPTGSRASFTVDKRVLDLKAKLLEEQKDHLDNNAVVADIENQLVKLDAELNKDDVSEGFFGPTPKLRAVGRRRSEIIYGMEGGLGGQGTFIKDALTTGLNYEMLPIYADVTTAASQSRGLLTAQGGELVKYNLRMFQNSLVDTDDCGTTGYIDIEVPKVGNDFLNGRRIFVGTKTVTLTLKDIPKLIGQVVKLRSPGTCMAKDRNCCKMCVDVNLAQRPDGIAIATAATTNVIMQDAMKAMHGRVNEAFDFILAEHIT